MNCAPTKYKISAGFDFKSPATAPALLSFMGVFGKRLFEPSAFFGEFPIAAHEAK
ncbi:MAG: hypothetical protein ABL920_10090 [Methylotenera sp.]